MKIFMVGDQEKIIKIDERVRELDMFFLHFFSFGISLIDDIQEFKLFFSRVEEGLETIIRRVYSSSGIDSRPYHKSDMKGFDLFEIEVFEKASQ